MTTPAEHAATVRSALRLDERVPGGNEGPLAALDALEAQAEQGTQTIAYYTRALDKAEAELALERIQRAFEFVPFNLYDEITKLAEIALGEFISDRDRLAARVEELERDLDDALDELNEALQHVEME